MHNYTYKDPSLRMKWLLAFYIFVLPLSFYSLFTFYQCHSLMTLVVSGGAVDRELLVSLDKRISTIALLRVLLVVPSCVFFCIWFYRIYANAAVLSVKPLEDSAGWAVGSIFIPIVNLFVPFLKMREANAVFASRLGIATEAWLIGLWWFFTVASGIVGLVANFVWKQAVNAQQFATAARFREISECASLMLTFVVIAMALAVTGKCRRLYASAGALQKV